MAGRRGDPALSRGRLARLVGLVLGVAVGAALVGALTVPLVGAPARVTLSVRPDPSRRTAIAWPAEGSAALYVPSAGIAVGHHVRVVPIASLTKMMTALVALARLPLAPGATGPCLTVGPAQVATYDAMVALDESSVVVAPGERLCESDLLAGTLVHSAGNYAVMLAEMAAGTTGAFVAMMNARAAAMGLAGTHYADVTGYDPASVSTATDQARVAAALMRFAVVRDLVDQATVTLPVAGTVTSYTPFVGEGAVIGVKSGRTGPAGGCDAMAVTFRAGGRRRVLYAVVTGQRDGDVLAAAGAAALALADSALAARASLVLRPGRPVATVGFGEGTVPLTVTRTVRLSWWPAPGALTLRVVARAHLGSVRRGERVAALVVGGVVRRRLALVATRALSRPTFLDRLR